MANRRVGKANRMTNRMGLFPQSHTTLSLRTRPRTTKYGVGLKTAYLNASALKVWKTSINYIKLYRNRHQTINVNNHSRISHSHG